ncbi:MAG: M20/M25/M40 family metallo-hydrolase, partial [Draconibacterium sp.]|nr:M20/M25/M40 family metallo-hydrolase [Draconibacterium sp.]
IVICFTFSNLSAQEEISDVKKWVEYLSDDDKMGRQNGSEEMKTVSNWIKDRYMDLDLQPFIDDSYFQDFTYTRRTEINERNVIGVLNGTETENPKYIVISAHYDHIGIRSGQPDSICNGADDNATGISAMLSVAKYFSDNSLSPKHSIVFASFSGEENGLRGSRHFCNNLSVDTSSIILNINFEMLGRPEGLGKQKYYITGIEYTNLYDILRGYNLDKDWKVENIGEMNKMLFRMSDNFPFANIRKQEGQPGIPAHTFAMGMPRNDYLHQPNDESKYIDFENLEGFSEYISELIYYLSTSDVEIRWTENFQKR